MIHHAKNTSNYSVIHNTAIRNRRMTWEARGVLHWLLSMPDDWEVSREALVKEGPGGRDRMARILDELEAFGHAVRRCFRTAEGKFDSKMDIYELPIDASSKTVTEKPSRQTDAGEPLRVCRNGSADTANPPLLSTIGRTSTDRIPSTPDYSNSSDIRSCSGSQEVSGNTPLVDIPLIADPQLVEDPPLANDPTVSGIPPSFLNKRGPGENTEEDEWASFDPFAHCVAHSNGHIDSKPEGKKNTTSGLSPWPAEIRELPPEWRAHALSIGESNPEARFERFRMWALRDHWVVAGGDWFGRWRVWSELIKRGEEIEEGNRRARQQEQKEGRRFAAELAARPGSGARGFGRADPRIEAGAPAQFGS